MKHIAQLYAKSSTGKIKVWRCDVSDNGEMITTHGYLDSKLTTQSKQIKGKNIGRSNATTDYEQAVLQAESKVREKMDEGYVKDQADLDGQILRLPILAHKFTERKHDIVYPCYVQPKLNGVRCLVDSSLSYISRKGKDWNTLQHLNKNVKALMDELGDPTINLDGELYRHDWNFQEITRATKKLRENTSKVEFWIFDATFKDTVYSDRLQRLRSAFLKLGTKDGENYRFGGLVLVPAYLATSEEEVMAWHEKFKKEFEGTIIRNANGLYVFKNRSKNLQKYKDFLDEEFPIIGGTEATGDDAGTVVFTCRTPSGAQFSVRPKGSREIRREWWENIDSLIGKELTVRYQELSEDGIPIFPVGLEVRDYE